MESLLTGECFPYPAFRCNFDINLCGFNQEKDDKFDWIRRKGSTPSRSTGPSADHTGGGMYIYNACSLWQQNKVK